MLMAQSAYITVVSLNFLILSDEDRDVTAKEISGGRAGPGVSGNYILYCTMYILK